MTAFSATVAPVPEGDGVVLTVYSTAAMAFVFWTENVSTSSTDYAALDGPPYGVVGTGANSYETTTIATWLDGEPETRESFRLWVGVDGQPGTEIELEADILDLRPHLSIDYAYDTFNQLVRHTLDADGEGPAASTDQFFAYEARQIVLQFGGPAAADLSHRYLWNPTAVDQLLADEAVTSLTSAGEVVWPLGDHLGTLRDLATYDEATNTTTIANHRQYDSFGNLTGETAAAVDLLFGYTGKLWDEEAQLQNSLNRIYDPLTGRFLTEDPIGFLGGDANLYRYVGNDPTMHTDPTGLFEIGFPILLTGGSSTTANQQAQETCTVWNNTKGMSLPKRAYVTGGMMAANPTGVRGVSDAFSQHDAVDAHEQSVGERVFDGVTGSVNLVGTGFGLKGMAMSGPRGTIAPSSVAPRSNAQLIQDIARRAENKIGGTGRLAGTDKHT